MKKLVGMTVYAIDEDLPAPGSVVHYLTPDGLTLESEYYTPDGGSAVARVSWTSLERAEQNYEAARQAAVARVPKWAERIAGLKGSENDTSRVRTLIRSRHGKLTLFTNTGPPTWWKPRATILRKGEYGIKAGWLNGCFILTWRPL